VSSTDQNEDRQLIAMQGLGIPKSQIYIDKQSGKDISRPKLQKLLITVENGDSVIVESVSRFARNTRDLLDLIEKLAIKRVEFVSLKENIDTSTPTGKFMLTVFGAVAELEREYILQRQAEGIKAAKARGVKFGRPEKHPPDNFRALIRKWERGQIKTVEVLEECNMSRSTFYTKLKEHKMLCQIRK